MKRKFKAYNKVSKTMSKPFILNSIYKYIDPKDIDNIVFLQFIWVRDKKWREIYQWDILQYNINWYKQKHKYIVSDIRDVHIELDRDDSYYRRDEDILIVGNIYEDSKR